MKQKTVTAIVIGVGALLVFGFGFLNGYMGTSTYDLQVAPRPIPRDLCALIDDETRKRIVPVAEEPDVKYNQDDTFVTTTCVLETDENNAPTFNDGRLHVQVTRFATEDFKSGAERARDTTLRGKPVPGLGDRADVRTEDSGPNRWWTRVDVIFGDTEVSIDYTAQVADRERTEAAAVQVARQIVAGIRW